MAKNWPKLSESLGERSPGCCQACGKSFEDPDLEMVRWTEHDENDRPTSTIVVLCQACSGAIIDPHPRLYDRLERNRPIPGAMGDCVHCRHREGLACRHPVLKANGGAGLVIRSDKPSVTFVDGVRNGRRFGYQTTTWRCAPKCDGKEAANV
jgi:hypothetical protein